MSYQGDIIPGQTLYFKFSTVNTSGAPTTLAGTPAVKAYKNGSTTESTSGITTTVDFDGVTGMHQVAVDTSADGTFYADDTQIALVITAGTVGGVSVVGAVVGRFGIGRLARAVLAAEETAIVAANANGFAAYVQDAFSELGSDLSDVPTTILAAFPTDFDLLSINGSGHVTLADASLTTAKLGTFSLAKTTNITGFNDLSAAQVNAEADTALSDLGLSSALVARVDNAATRFLTMIALNGLAYVFTEPALANAPAGGGGNGTTRSITITQRGISVSD